MGKEKPEPIKLKLTARDMARYKIRRVNFDRATFDNNENKEESYIVVNTGEFVITWNFQKVLKGCLSDYKIKKMDQEIVQTDFRFNKEDQVLLTAKGTVTLGKRKAK